MTTDTEIAAYVSTAVLGSERQSDALSGTSIEIGYRHGRCVAALYHVDVRIAFEADQHPIPAMSAAAADPQEWATQLESSPRALTTPHAISINWSRIGRAGLSSQLFTRLFRLAARLEGWRGPGSRALDSLSLAEFLKFWTVIRENAAEPNLSLLPNGHLGAEWYRSGRRHLDIEFAHGGIVYFGLFNGDTEIEGKEALLTTAELLLAHPAKPFRWKGA